jgi:hypothetical protein
VPSRFAGQSNSDLDPFVRLKWLAETVARKRL